LKFNDKDKSIINANNYDFNYKVWKSEKESSDIIIAVHGYNDYSNAFQIPGTFLSTYNIDTIAFDLRGFGINEDNGNWFHLKFHLEDLKFTINKIKKNNPNKNIYLLGESMGGAIVLSLIQRNKILPIKGVILVAPAIWNFSNSNYWKSIPLRIFSKLFPDLKVSGKTIIKVQASNNHNMLEELSNDKLFIHKPNLRSLQGVIDLMDESFVDAQKYFNKPTYNTLILVPLIDEIVPRKPLIEILNNKKLINNLNHKIHIGLYKDSYHMILRDINGDEITKDIKDWVYDKNSFKNNTKFQNLHKMLTETEFYHKLD